MEPEQLISYVTDQVLYNVFLFSELLFLLVDIVKQQLQVKECFYFKRSVVLKRGDKKESLCFGFQ